MIKRNYYAMCDFCGDILRDPIFGTYSYHDTLFKMREALLEAGWKEEEQEDGSIRDYCLDCQ